MTFTRYDFTERERTVVQWALGCAAEHLGRQLAQQAAQIQPDDPEAESKAIAIKRRLLQGRMELDELKDYIREASRQQPAIAGGAA